MIFLCVVGMSYHVNSYPLGVCAYPGDLVFALKVSNAILCLVKVLLVIYPIMLLVTFSHFVPFSSAPTSFFAFVSIIFLCSTFGLYFISLVLDRVV